jgi:hypothetical protein
MMGMITTEHSREDGLRVLEELPDYDSALMRAKSRRSAPISGTSKV